MLNWGVDIEYNDDYIYDNEGWPTNPKKSFTMMGEDTVICFVGPRINLRYNIKELKSIVIQELAHAEGK